MDKSENKKVSSEKFKDVSRFTRWVNQLDEKDKTLNPAKRKSKWAITVAVLVLLFGLSFIWFPAVKLDSENIEVPGKGKGTELQKQSGNTGFEMPVDSFEQQLKRKIDEDLSEKE
jgi:hypothetical protein